MMSFHQHVELLQRWDRGLALREVVRRTVRPGLRVLDAGCGTGLLSLWAAQCGADEILGVDTGDLGCARALAAENGFEARVRFETLDLSVGSEGADGSDGSGGSEGSDDSDGSDGSVDERWDVVFAMLFYNDPRRDEGQSRLVRRLAEHRLAAGGVLVPSRVEYSAAACDWPAQDGSSRLRHLESTRSVIESRYGLRLGAFIEAARASLHPSLFPVRGQDGRFAREGLRMLSGESDFTTVDHVGGFERYPEVLRLEVEAAGTLTSVLWTQRLCWDDVLVFLNESVSWLREPIAVRRGDRVELRIDDDWRESNFLTRA